MGTMTMPALKPAVVQVPAKVSMTVDVVKVPTKVSTTTTDEKAVFNNVDSQIGTQVADGGPQQIASQTITSTGAVVQKPAVAPAIPVVPTKPMTMTMNGMTMTMPGLTPGTKLPTMTVATPGVVSNVGKQVGVQNVATTGTFNNVGSQIGVQMGRKKRAAQFNGFGGFGTMNMNGMTMTMPGFGGFGGV